MALKAKILGIALALFLMPGSVAFATVYSVTFDNVLIDNNPNYPITGSFFYNPLPPDQPGQIEQLFGFQVTAVTPYGVLDMNTLWEAVSGHYYLGLETGPCCSSSVPAIQLNFPYEGPAGDTFALYASTGTPMPIVSTGPGGDPSALTPSVTVLYDGPSSDLLPISGSLDFVATPLPATLPLFATGIGGLGLLGWRRKRKAQTI